METAKASTERRGPSGGKSPRRLGRRPVVALFLGVLMSVVAFSAKAESDALWRAYQGRFVAADGRVVDTGNHGVSHSEGQGYGMLFAEAAGDKAAFDRIWSWTQKTLQHKNDALFAWRWKPGAGAAAGVVDDPNDASDGDVLIAWALARAAKDWGREADEAEARRIAVSILASDVVEAGGRTLLLPGAAGFRRQGGTVVNLSYWIYPAFSALDAVLPDKRWAALGASGMALTEEARFGAWDLPPDWLEVGKDGSLAPAKGFDPVYGFNAVRIPLNLLWGGAPTSALGPYRTFWGAFTGKPFIPATANLETGALAPYSMSRGVSAIKDLVEAETASSPAACRRACLALVHDASGAVLEEDYYSASLALLTLLAAQGR